LRSKCGMVCLEGPKVGEFTDRSIDLFPPDPTPTIQPVPDPTVIPFHLAPGEAPLMPETLPTLAPEPTLEPSADLSTSNQTFSAPWLVTHLHVLPPIPPPLPPSPTSFLPDLPERPHTPPAVKNLLLNQESLPKHSSSIMQIGGLWQLLLRSRPTCTMEHATYRGLSHF
jgi:hypothetical protein